MSAALLAGLAMLAAVDIAIGQFGKQPPEEMTMDQIILRTMGGMDAVANRLTLPNGTILAELDMYLTNKQYKALYPGKQQRRKKRKAIRPNILRWPNGEVPYAFDNRGYNDVDKYFIKVAMREWEKYTCLRFHERTNEQNYVLFQDGFGCNSQLGMVGGPQVLNLDRNGCRFKGLYLHEIGHAVGLIHEHQRPIRDNFIDIIYSNVQPVMRQWFNKYPDREINSFGVDYEYSSVMHYGVTAFSSDGRSKTIQPKPQFRDRENEIGRVYQKELSFTDIESVSKMYGCSDHCDSSVKCTGGGFLDQNCECLCPDGSQDCQEGSVKPPANCVNQNGKDWQCNIWAKQGECARNKDYMYSNCQRACGLCGDAFEQHPDVGDQCLNFYSDDICEKWKELGDCVVNEQWMKKYCKRTCGMCVEGGILPGTNCPNAYTPEEDCYKWALKGECGANPRWMPFNCAKACRTCKGGDDTGTVLTTRRPTRSNVTTPVVTTRRPTLRTTTTPKPVPDCRDRYQPEKCQEFQNKWKFCSVHKMWMEANCMETCGLCSTSDGNDGNDDKTAFDKCKDENKYCKSWAENSQCVANPGYMLKFCPRSCRACTAGLRDTFNDPGYKTGEQKSDIDTTAGNGQSVVKGSVSFLACLLFICRYIGL